MERKEVIENIELGFWNNLGGMKTPKLHRELIKLLFYEINDDYLDDISTIEDVYKLCSNGGALSEDDIDNTMVRLFLYGGVL